MGDSDGINLWLPKQFDKGIESDQSKGEEIRVIFLDVDGVLNCAATKESFRGYIGIDDTKVEILRKIVEESSEETETKIVITSSWRVGINRDGAKIPQMYQYLCDKLDSKGLSIYDTTPVLSFKGRSYGGRRGHEIVAWLYEHMDRHISGYVVLDDCVFEDFETCGLIPYLVRTSWSENTGGLCKKHIKPAIEILRKKERIYDNHW